MNWKNIAMVLIILDLVLVGQIILSEKNKVQLSEDIELDSETFSDIVEVVETGKFEICKISSGKCVEIKKEQLPS